MASVLRSNACQHDDSDKSWIHGLDNYHEDLEFESRFAEAIREGKWMEVITILLGMHKFWSDRGDDEETVSVSVKRVVMDATMSVLSDLLRERADPQLAHRRVPKCRVRTFIRDLPSIQKLVRPNHYDDDMFRWYIPPIHLLYDNTAMQTEWDLVTDVITAFPLCLRQQSALAYVPDLPFRAALNHHTGASFQIFNKLLQLTFAREDDDVTASLRLVSKVLSDALREHAPLQIVHQILQIGRKYPRLEILARNTKADPTAFDGGTGRETTLASPRHDYLPDIHDAYNGYQTDWDVILAVLREYPEYTNLYTTTNLQHYTTPPFWHHSPLHEAVAFNAPFSVILDLLNISPQSVFQTTSNHHDFHCHHRPGGSLPLHFAVSSHNSHRDHDVIAELLKRYPGGADIQDCEYLYPLDHFLEPHQGMMDHPTDHILFHPDDYLIVKQCIDACPGYLTRTTGTELLTPLHRLARLKLTSASAAAVVHEFLRRCPEAANIPDLNGRYPLQIVCCPGDITSEGLSNDDSSTITNDAWWSFSLEPRWEFQIFQQLLHANPQASMEADGDGYLPLHYACFFSDPRYARELLRIFPEGAMMKTGKGEYPLHLVCRHGDSLMKYGKCLPVLSDLLRIFPEAVYARDEFGRFPLHNVINSWRQKNSYTTQDFSFLLDQVLRRNPEAIFAPIRTMVELRGPRRSTEHRCKLRNALEMALMGDIPSMDGVEDLLRRAFKEYDDNNTKNTTLSSTYFPSPHELRPLHSLCAISSYSQSHAASVALSMAIRELHSMFPCDIRSPCSKGLLPLHWLFHSNSEGVAFEVTMAMLEIFGGAVLIPDKISGLTAFEVACLHGGNGISVLYLLLRQGPEVLQQSLRKEGMKKMSSPPPAMSQNKEARYEEEKIADDDVLLETMITIGWWDEKPPQK